MAIYDYKDYKQFVIEKVQQMPKHGHGEYQRIAVALRLHTTSVSQIFKGQRELSHEQAAALCLYFGFTEKETDYFITLVSLARAGTKQLKAVHERRIQALQEQAKMLSHRINENHIITDAEKNKFYSEWYYSAIRLLTDLPEYSTVDQIKERLNLPTKLVTEVLQFLISTGLCVEENGKTKLGAQRTFIAQSSPLITRHHANWRLQAIQRYQSMDHERELAFTSPMTLSKKDVIQVRSLLLETIESILKVNTVSASEELHVLNIDWLKI